MKKLAQLKPGFQALQRRMAKFRRDVKVWRLTVFPYIASRKVTSILYLFAALVIVASVAMNTNLVCINDGASPARYILTLRKDSAAILAQCGVSVGKDDAVDFSGVRKNFAEIEITRAISVTLIADNKVRNIQIARGTVADVLKKSGVTLNASDLISPALSQSVAQGMGIRIQRVTYREVVLKQTLSFAVNYQQTTLLGRGIAQVLQSGRAGQKAITLLQRYVDGVKASEQVVGQQVTAKPVNGLMLVGTANSTPVSQIEPAGFSLTSRGEPIRYRKCLVGKATAYTAKKPSGTASGRRARVGVVAVDPRVIPYGTRLYITSSDGSFVYGYAIAGDTGGFVYD
ncbi:MAG: ubiquitin-like domain-containing protein, partial [Clostridia bacterium]|nr:ubiquitin-like domain-containing protein [Clostridia bacterium]